MLLQIKQQARVPILGIDWKDQNEDALAWLAQLGNPYERVATDRDGRVAIDWGVYGAPESFLINPAGTVVYKHIGAMTEQVWQSEFLPRVNAAAGAPAAPASRGHSAAITVTTTNGKIARPLARKILLIPQRLDRMERCRFAGGIDSEEESHSR